SIRHPDQVVRGAGHAWRDLCLGLKPPSRNKEPSARLARRARPENPTRSERQGTYFCPCLTSSTATKKTRGERLRARCVPRREGESPCTISPGEPRSPAAERIAHDHDHLGRHPSPPDTVPHAPPPAQQSRFAVA